MSTPSEMQEKVSMETVYYNKIISITNLVNSFLNGMNCYIVKMETNQSIQGNFYSSIVSLHCTYNIKEGAVFSYC